MSQVLYKSEAHCLGSCGEVLKSGWEFRWSSGSVTWASVLTVAMCNSIRQQKSPPLDVQSPVSRVAARTADNAKARELAV